MNDIGNLWLSLSQGVEEFTAVQAETDNYGPDPSARCVTAWRLGGCQSVGAALVPRYQFGGQPRSDQQPLHGSDADSQAGVIAFCFLP
jgi:hypothetical protein